MSKPRPHVPETHDRTPNREQRRHPDRPEAEAEDAPLARDEHPPDQEAPPKRQEIYRQGPQDVTDARAKNSGHKKKTADNWNQ
jgi:hypothetical protein